MIEQLDFSAAASASQRKPRAGLIVSGLVSSAVDVGDCKLHPKSSEHVECCESLATGLKPQRH